MRFVVVASAARAVTRACDPEVLSCASLQLSLHTSHISPLDSRPTPPLTTTWARLCSQHDKLPCPGKKFSHQGDLRRKATSNPGPASRPITLPGTAVPVPPLWTTDEEPLRGSTGSSPETHASAMSSHDSCLTARHWAQ